MIFHPFHIVNRSPWPLISSFVTLIFVFRLIQIIHNNDFLIIKLRFILTLLCIFQWWRDILREAVFLGYHTLIVKRGLKWGIMLFIVSEIIFFFSFFWSYFYARLAPDISLGVVWPPKNINNFNPYHIPLLNTAILLASGVTVTWAHHNILTKNYSERLTGLLLTCVLGLYFRILQGFEYLEASFSITDRIFGAAFFLLTGFHGLHVIIGTTFLRVCAYRIFLGHFRKSHHFGFEAAAWYWHFVDVVWLFLYTFVYWWIY